jgi:predicted TIM-barrel fold metal-dependent hydrolase
MATLQFADSHVHFYDLRHASLRYEWLAVEARDPELGDHSAIKSVRYWPDDFLAETRFHNVSKIIHVQAALGTSDPVAETSWLHDFVVRLGVPHGIVAAADLAAPNAADVLRRHAEYPNVRGVRDFRYDDYLEDERWQEGYSLLERHNLVCCIEPILERMPAAIALAGRFPRITLCIDHSGFPRERNDAYFHEWRRHIRKLAQQPNIVIKISGLGQGDHRWTVASLRPWVLTCIEAFGTQRSFFGTNWPVDRLYSSYGDVVNAYAEIIAGFTTSEQRALFADNASRIFGLDD